ncbi:MAG: hypothetical protein CVU43_00075 [Chloroflexi bacterium HGW-Chloroflexi-5]|jgi:SAM-dependent methyltransferase|nr:MAG: hypothetical protein CVU43_00075 [Chloroflexi bacterium HGW-Chloroflexi-5]
MIDSGDINHKQDTRVSSANEEFEKAFMSLSLENQILHCDHYELLDFFRKWLPTHQPILEAGCGSGRWVVWFTNQGWQATGLDWSSTLIDRARQAFPKIRFDIGDMRDMPYLNDQFGSIISLGAIEHTPEGPMKSLFEYHRVLKPNGIAIITVPYLSLVRKVVRFVTKLKLLLKRNKLIRTLFGKPSGNKSFNEAKKETLANYAADYVMTDQGWEFFQYHFSKKQMNNFLTNSNFEIIEEIEGFAEEGILHNFGKLSGKYNYEKGTVSLSWIGKILLYLVPIRVSGHMLCYIVKKI